jgi:hypothetical protein
VAGWLAGWLAGLRVGKPGWNSIEPHLNAPPLRFQASDPVPPQLTPSPPHPLTPTQPKSIPPHLCHQPGSSLQAVSELYALHPVPCEPHVVLSLVLYKMVDPGPEVRGAPSSALLWESQGLRGRVPSTAAARLCGRLAGSGMR